METQGHLSPKYRLYHYTVFLLKNECSVIISERVTSTNMYIVYLFQSSRMNPKINTLEKPESCLKNSQYFLHLFKKLIE